MSGLNEQFCPPPHGGVGSAPSPFRRCHGLTTPFIITVVTLIVSACRDTTTDTPAGPSPTVATDAQTTDQVWADLSRGQIPGFAGIFVENDYIIVSATEAASEAQALNYAREWRTLSAHRGAPIRFRQVEFSAEQLEGWKTSLVDLLDDPRVLWTDAHEQSNRLMVGVVSPSATDAVRGQITDRGIPDGALVVTESGREVEARDTFVYNTVRPVKGGIEIHNGVGRCTLGFNTEYNGEPAVVTNSHCSVDPAAVDTTVFTQSSPGQSGTPIAFEVADPATSSGWMSFAGLQWNCTAGTGCRFSDAQVSEYYDTVGSVQGRIARTTEIGMGEPGSRLLDSLSYFEIVGRLGVPGIYGGLDVEKVGRTTGWTGGEITNTCMDLGYTWVRKLCQFGASYYAEDGDSGSPVFVRFPHSEVVLVGIHYGTKTTNGEWVASRFSSLSGIVEDLGVTMGVCVTSGCTGGPVRVSLEGPEAVPPNEFCAWEAHASWGTPPYTYEWYIDNDLESETSSEILVPVGMGSFTLAVVVWDDIGQGDDKEIEVDVDSENPSCTF